MSWKRLSYGIIAASALATGGTLLWFSTRKHVASVDWIEVAESALERVYALQTAAGSYAVTTQQVWDTDWTGTDSTGLTWIEYDTNGIPSTNSFVAPAGSNLVNIVTTNRTGYSYGASVDSEPRWTYTRRELGTNKWIWGPWETLSATGFAGSGYAIDGIYGFSNRVFRTWPFNLAFVPPDFPLRRCAADVYTNSTNAYVILDYGPMYGLATDLNAPGNYRDAPFSWGIYDDYGWATEYGAALYLLPSGHHPARSNEWLDYQVGVSAPAGAKVSLGSFRTSVTHRAAWTEQTRSYTNAIPTVFSRDIFQAWSDMLREAAQGHADGSTNSWADDHYIDHTLATGGEFVGTVNDGERMAISISVPALVARLGIGFTNSSYQLCFTDENSSGTITNTWVTTNAITERYVLAEALQWTCGGEDGGEWTANGETNYWVWYGVSTNAALKPGSWNEAKQRAISNMTASIANAAPRMWTAGYQYEDDDIFGDPRTTWVARAETCRAMLKTEGDMATNITKDVDFYLSGVKPDYDWTYPHLADTLERNWDANGTNILNGTNIRFEVQQTVSAASATSAWYGVSSTIGTWCRAPTNHFDTVIRGYLQDREETIRKWHFTACTNPL